MTDQQKIREFVDANSKRFVNALEEACSIPSISAEGQGLEEMYAWLEKKFGEMGAKTSRLDGSDGPPALLGDLEGAGGRTLMIYDHYDVQPVDPLDLWETPPFEPSVRKGRLYARGAADNKGDLVARLCALEVYRELIGDLPFNIKFFVEGEEESGSPNFEEICENHAGQLAAEHCVWEGAGFDAAGRPALHFGCKGLLYVEFTCRRLSGDQHSATAAILPSAAWELLRAIASIKDDQDRIVIDGFYDDVVEPGEVEIQMLAKLPSGEEEMKKATGVDSFLKGLSGPELMTELIYAATANIAGQWSGYTVPGATKTVLPAQASVKMDFRLVPDQNAKDIATKLRAHLDKGGFENVETKVLSAENPSRSSIDTKLAKAVTDAATEWFDDPPSAFPLVAGTGPMYPVAQGLGIPIANPAGVSRIDSYIHAPNENVRISDYLDVIGMTVLYLDKYGRG